MDLEEGLDWVDMVQEGHQDLEDLEDALVWVGLAMVDHRLLWVESAKVDWEVLYSILFNFRSFSKSLILGIGGCSMSTIAKLPDFKLKKGGSQGEAWCATVRNRAGKVERCDFCSLEYLPRKFFCRHLLSEIQAYVHLGQQCVTNPKI